MSKKVKVSDVRQGVTLYYVHAFPYKGPNLSYIEAVRVTKPRYPTITGGTFAEGRFFMDDGDSYVRPFSLRDAGIVPNRYNFHNTFTSLKKAKQYAARMDRVCLNAAEMVKYREKVRDLREDLALGFA